MKSIVRPLFSLVVVLIAISALTFTAAAQEAQTPEAICTSAEITEPTTREYTQPEQVLEVGVDYRAIFCTDVGAIYIDLLQDQAPITVNSFVFLAQNGYYNNTTFHRVIENFMAQGGDPTATGTGGPGYRFEDEFVGFLTFERAGWLAMANAGAGTNGSQFFITTAPASHLNFRHTIFGEVLEGQSIVESIRLRDPQSDPAPGTALNTVVILTDPQAVTTSYVAPDAVTSEQIEAVFAEVNAEIPPILSLFEGTGIIDTDAVIASAPETLRDAVSAALTANNHDYRATHGVANATCDLASIPYMEIRYTLDHYATSADARAALAGGIYSEIAEVSGYDAAGVFPTLPNGAFTRTVTACEQTAVEAIGFWQRGRFVVTALAVFPLDTPAPVNVWLYDLVGGGTYEQILSALLRQELR